MIGFGLTTCTLGIFGILVLGIAAEMRHQTMNALFLDLKIGWQRTRRALHEKWLHHPSPAVASVETLFWGLMLIPLVDHLLNTPNGITAAWVWYLTIGPHELGHVVCIPFGRFLTVAGGSFWQIMFWAGLGSYTLFVYRRIGRALLMGLIAGHSFINLSVYIRDASDRNLDLLFGLDKDAHDWWNLLRWLGLLDYDYLIADSAMTLGFFVSISMICLGIFTAWILPRQRGMRYHGFLWTALAREIKTTDDRTH